MARRGTGRVRGRGGSAGGRVPADRTRRRVPRPTRLLTEIPGESRRGLCIAVLPLVAYLTYLWAIRGSPFAFLTDERVGWLREFKGPISAFLTTLRFVGDQSLDPNFRIAYAGEVAAAAIGLAFTAWAVSRRLWGYAAFMGTTLVTLLVSTHYFSVPRALLSLFPIVLLIAFLHEGAGSSSRPRPRRLRAARHPRRHHLHPLALVLLTESVERIDSGRRRDDRHRLVSRRGAGLPSEGRQLHDPIGESG